MLFKDIIGQTHTKQRLVESVDNQRVSHSQMLLGPEGSGKLALALAFAGYLTCENPAGGDACGTCNACRKNAKYIHPDVHFVFPVINTSDGTSKTVSDHFIKQWRSFLQEEPYGNLNNWLGRIAKENQQGRIFAQESQEIYRKLNLKTYEAAYKVMIIWMPEKMNQVAANKLLKILEEPSGDTVFLLVAESTEQMLPTILSRTQVIKTPKIKHEDLRAHLAHHHKLDEAHSQSIAATANGNYLKALELMRNDDQQQRLFTTFTEWMRLAYSRKIEELVQWVEDMARWGRENQKNFLSYALRMIRENFVLNLDKRQHPEMLHLAQKENQFSEKFSTFITLENAFAIASELEKAHYHIERNGYAKLIFMDTSLKIVKLLRMNESRQKQKAQSQ